MLLPDYVEQTYESSAWPHDNEPHSSEEQAAQTTE